MGRSTTGCSIPGCKSKTIDIIYLRFRLCERCWNKFASKDVSVLKKKLGIKVEASKEVISEENTKEQNETSVER